MIGSLRGKVILKDGLNILIEVGGVGYKVLVSEKTRGKVNIDSPVFIYTYTLVREDELSLFGFLEIEDIKLFESLISVSGVGPKTAMSIFSILSREEIVNAVLNGDTTAFTAVPRLGTKNAQKIIIELKNKLGEGGSLDFDRLYSEANDEVMTALQGFGFSRREIADALKNIDSEAKTSEEKIKLALKQLGK